jgi:uncharacterized membrane protein
MGDILRRIIASKKFVMAMVALVINVLVSWLGIADPTQPIMQLVDAVFMLLIAIQGLLDFKWGSGSDRTGKFQLAGSS